MSAAGAEQPDHVEGRSARVAWAPRIIVLVSAAVAVFAVVARMHDVAAYPAMYDFDAGGHAVNVLDLSAGRLPDLRSWQGSQAPLYYAVGAALWSLLPDRIPVHVMLRSISVAAWIGTVVLVWRSLRRLGFGVDSGVVATLMLGIPGMVIASCMMTNDPLSAFFVTATLARLLDVQRGRAPGVTHAAATGACAGLAAMTKATGVAAVAVAALFYAWRSRHEPIRAVRNVLVVGVTSVLIAGPHYARLFLSISGPAYQIVGTRAGSQEKEAIGHFVYAAAPTRRSFESFVALFHASLWGDPLAVFLPVGTGSFGVALSIGGLLVAALVAAGVVRLIVDRDVAARASAALVFGVLYALALLPLVWIGPWIVLTKVNYLLVAALPLAILVAAGLTTASGGVRTALRAALLTIAAGGVAVTWYGWWEQPQPPPPPLALASASPSAAARTVERYFADRAHDPIRAASRLAPEAHLAHGLRLARILGVSLPPESLAPDAERSLEIARARVAWLDLYNLVRWIQPFAGALDVRVSAVNQQRDIADVTVRVGASTPHPPPGARIGRWPFPPFEQRFTLRRAGETWEITGIEQSGVVDESAVAGFVANPTFDGLERLRALGWRPSWDAAFAAMLRRAEPGREDPDTQRSR